MTGSDAGRDALALLDKALADRPVRDGKTLKMAVQRMATFREHVTDRHRAENGSPSRLRLDHVNAVLSVVIAAEFPIGEVPWTELEKARDWLGAILDRDEVQ